MSNPEFSLMVFTLIARITSALMGTGTVLVNYYTAKRLYGHRAGLISALLIASSYAVIYYSHNANVDVPQLFWISLALYSFVSLLETYEMKYYTLLGLRPLDVDRLCCNKKRIKQMIGWEPEISLLDGLRKTIEWYERNGRTWIWEVKMGSEDEIWQDGKKKANMARAIELDLSVQLEKVGRTTFR